MAGTVLRKPCASNTSRYSAKFERKPVLIASPAAGLKSGVSINSKYCSFWAAARLATSSIHSLTWLLLVPPNFSNVWREVIVARLAGLGDECAHGK